MSKGANLTKIGTKVKIDLDQVKDRIPSTLVSLLSQDPRGKVLGYKMTDGTGIGVVLELSDGTANWFFDNEITRA